MSVNPIGLAIPFFFAAIGIELFVARAQRRHVYRLNDAIADLGSGVGDQTLTVLSRGLFFGGYVYVYETTAVWQWRDVPPVAAWALAILTVDLCYYWFHRFSHRTGIGWAFHVVHHQSEEYNLAVALRQSWFSKSISWLFYLPLAVIGLPPYMYAASFSINLIYQFWIHTRVVGRLGPLEWLLNTPSHHRVHHGVESQYLDKNYAGIFIIWDRLFNTFEQEQLAPTYGVLHPIRTWNPWRANVRPLQELIGRTAEIGWRAIVFPPEGSTGARQPASPPPDRGYDQDPNVVWKVYLVAQFSLAAGAITGLLLWGNLLSAWVSTAVGVWILLSVSVVGTLFDSEPSGLWKEKARLLLQLGLGAVLWTERMPTLSLMFSGAATISGVLLLGISRRHRIKSGVDSDAVLDMQET